MARRTVGAPIAVAVALFLLALGAICCGLGERNDEGTNGVTPADPEQVPGRVATAVRLLVDLAVLDPWSAALFPAIADPVTDNRLGIRLPDPNLGHCEEADPPVSQSFQCRDSTDPDPPDAEKPGLVQWTIEYDACRSSDRRLTGKLEISLEDAADPAVSDGCSNPDFRPTSGSVTFTSFVDERLNDSDEVLLKLTWANVDAALGLGYPSTGENCGEQPDEMTVGITTASVQAEGLQPDLTGTVTYEGFEETITIAQDDFTPETSSLPCQAKGYAATVSRGTIRFEDDAGTNSFAALLEDFEVTTQDDREDFSVSGTLKDPDESSCFGGSVSVNTTPSDSQIDRLAPQECPINGDLTVGQDTVSFTGAGGLEVAFQDGSTCSHATCTEVRACDDPEVECQAPAPTQTAGRRTFSARAAADKSP